MHAKESQGSSLPQHVMTRHTSLLISSVHTHTPSHLPKYTSPLPWQCTHLSSHTPRTPIARHTHLYNCTAVITQKYSQRTTVVTSPSHTPSNNCGYLLPSHTTLPLYCCGYISIAHIHGYVHTLHSQHTTRAMYTHLYTLSIQP